MDNIEFEYRVVDSLDKRKFEKTVSLYLNDGTGWYLEGGVSISLQFTTVHYAQALIRDKLK